MGYLPIELVPHGGTAEALRVHMVDEGLGVGLSNVGEP